MAYDIRIGEVVYTDIENDDGQYRCAWEGVAVQDTELEDAPIFPGDDDSIGKSNWRGPSYIAWDEFGHDVGLHDMFFDEDTGLMREHPGTFALTSEHLVQVRTAIVQRKKDQPNAIPGFGDGRDYNLARLLWLEFWMDWALKNCKRPAFSNH